MEQYPLELVAGPRPTNTITAIMPPTSRLLLKDKLLLQWPRTTQGVEASLRELSRTAAQQEATPGPHTSPPPHTTKRKANTMSRSLKMGALTEMRVT